MHQLIERKNNRQRYAARIAAGKCPSCGKRPPRPGRRTCETCGKANSVKTARSRDRKKAAWIALHLCPYCPEHREAMPGHKSCGVCAETFTEKSMAMHRRWIEEGRCRRCGKPRDREGTYCSTCSKRPVGR